MYNDETVASKTFTVSVQEFGSVDTGLLKNDLTLIMTERFENLDYYDLSNIHGYVNGLETTEELVYEIKSGEDVVKIANGKLTALAKGEAEVRVYFSTESENVYDANIRVTVEELRLDSFRYFADEDGRYTELSYMGTFSTEETLVDVSKLPTPISAADVKEVKVNDEKVDFVKIDGEKLLRLPKQAVGETKLSFVTTDKTVEHSVLVVDYVISDFASFQKYMKEARATVLYAILTTDIISTTGMAASTACGANINNASGAVFDGNGYTVSGIYTYRGWFGRPEPYDFENFTMKNVTVDKHYIGTGSIFGYGLWKCRLENVTWTVEPTAEFFAAGCNLLVTYSYYTTYTNCKFKIVVPEGYEDKVIKITKDEPNATGNSYYKSTYNNVTFESNGLIADFGEQDSWGYQTNASAVLTGSTYTIVDASKKGE